MFSKTIFFFIFIAFVQPKDLPSYLINLRCSIKEDFEKCFLQNGNKAIPIVAKGDPDYNLPNMDPLEIPFFKLISTPSLGMNVSDVKVLGLKNMRLEGLKMDITRGLYTILTKANKMSLEGKYVIDGKIMVLPIKGNGHFVINLENGSFKITTTGRNYEKDGDKYYEPMEIRLDYHFGKVDFNFDNLFEGNPKLAEDMNKFLNDNWDLIIVDFGPGISEAIGQYILRIFKAFTADIPMRNIFAE